MLPVQSYSAAESVETLTRFQSEVGEQALRDVLSHDPKRNDVSYVEKTNMSFVG